MQTDWLLLTAKAYLFAPKIGGQGVDALYTLFYIRQCKVEYEKLKNESDFVTDILPRVQNLRTNQPSACCFKMVC